MNIEKFKNLILFIVSEINPENLGKTKLFKLIFFVDYESHKKFGSLITGDTYLKFPRGPVPKSASSVIRKMEDDGELKVVEQLRDGYFMTLYEALKDPVLDVFSNNELKIVNHVVDNYGSKSRGRLVKISHDLDSWSKVELFEEMTFTNEASPSPEIFVNEYKNDMNILSSE